MALAKSRTWRGLTTATGSPAAPSVLAASRARPPVASSTIRVGAWRWSRRCRVASPVASLGTVQPCSWGRTATTRVAWATSIPTNTAGFGIRTSGRGVARFPLPQPCKIRACPVQRPWQLCGFWEPTSVTTLAPPRSSWTLGHPVCHARVATNDYHPITYKGQGGGQIARWSAGRGRGWARRGDRALLLDINEVYPMRDVRALRRALLEGGDGIGIGRP